MKKHLKKLMLVFLTAALICASCMPVMASTNRKIVTMPKGSWKTMVYGGDASSNYSYYYYKIVIPSDGYITLKKYSASSSVSIYDSKFNNVNSDLYSNSSTKTISVGVKKGTYYLKCGYGGAKAKYTFTAVKRKANYSKKTAVSLKSGKKVNIVQTNDYNYSRWYKIKTTSKKYIKVASKTPVYIELYDKNGKYVSISTNSSYITSYKKLSAGTYYIKVTTKTSFETGKANYTYIKWS